MMNPKLKKIIAIAGLVFMGLFLVSMIMYFVRPDFFEGMLWLFSALCFGITIVLFCAIYFTRGFPSQQAKDAEFKRAEEEYYKKLEESESAETESDEKENTEGETVEKPAGETDKNNKPINTKK